MEFVFWVLSFRSNSMRPTVSQYAEALEVLSQEGSLDVSQLTKNVVGFLKRRGESDTLEVIVESLEKRAALKENRLAVIVTAAHELTAKTKALLMKKVEGLFPEKKIDFVYEMDTAVIGGVSFRTDEVLYDATVVSELAALKKTIAQ